VVLVSDTAWPLRLRMEAAYPAKAEIPGVRQGGAAGKEITKQALAWPGLPGKVQ